MGPPAGPTTALAPLRRRPKRLTTAPQLFATGRGTPVAIDLDLPADRTQAPEQDLPVGGQGTGPTAREATRRDLSELLADQPTDLEVAAMARRIARRLSLRARRPRPDVSGHGGPLTPTRFHHRSDELDLERTVAVLLEHPAPTDTDLIVRERRRRPTATVLVVDVSGSMRGEKAAIAAATAAALAGDLHPGTDQLAVVAFWSDAAVLSSLRDPTQPARLLDQLLRIPAQGLTNVEFALRVAETELRTSTAARRRVLLLSDAVHNAGPDPRLLAPRLPQLHVLLEVDGEHDHALARDLARLGRGRLARVTNHRDVAPALERLLRD